MLGYFWRLALERLHDPLFEGAMLAAGVCLSLYCAVVVYFLVSDRRADLRKSFDKMPHAHGLKT